MAKSKTTKAADKAKASTFNEELDMQANSGGFRLVRPSDGVIIGLDTKDGPDHPLYDPRIHSKLNEARIQSIMEDGILQNASVTVVEGVGLVVVDGRGRFRHAREAEKRLQTTTWTDRMGNKHAPDPDARVWVPVKLRQGDDAQLFHLMVVANAQRDVEGPVAEARKADIMQKRFNMSDEQVCQSFGWGIGTLRNRRKLLALDPKVQRDVESRQLSVMAALDLGKLPAEEQAGAADKLAAEAEDKGTTRGQTRSARQVTAPEKDPVIGKRQLRAILESDKAEGLSEDTARVIRWILGDIQAVAIKGLSACINDVEAKRKAAAAKKNEAARERIKAKAEAKGKKAPTNKAEAPKTPPKRRGKAAAEAQASA